MAMTYEGLVVGLLALLPGFVSGRIRSAMGLHGPTSTAKWMLLSIVSSLAMNAFVIMGFLAAGSGQGLAESNPAELRQRIEGLTLASSATYVGVLYAVAVAWGVLPKLAPAMNPRMAVYLSRLTPVSPAPDVFNEGFSELFRSKQNLRLRGTGCMNEPWVRVAVEGRLLFGRVRYTSARVDVDKPIEMFLAPACFVVSTDDLPTLVESKRIRGKGDDHRKAIYLRIRPEQAVEVFSFKEILD